MKVALVHDWLNGMRGGEKVLEVLCELYPGADIFTLLCDPRKISATIRGHRVTTSFIQKLPWARKHYRHYLPLFPAAIEQFDLRGYDLVISTSHCVAKGVITAPGTTHVCYCFTPMRYAWEQYADYFPPERLGFFARWFIPVAMSRLRVWDVATANRVDTFLAISYHVAARIRKFYGRTANVVFPPVDASRFIPGGPPEDYYLVVSALVPYKRIDRAIAACNLLNLPLKVVGDGPERARLRKLAGPTVSFLDPPPTEKLAELYSRCRAFLFPGEEDFGITPLEAMACGRPVVAYGRGGVTETVVDGKTGILFAEPTPESMAADITRSHAITWDSKVIRRRAMEFDRPLFKRRIERAIANCLPKPPHGSHAAHGPKH